MSLLLLLSGTAATLTCSGGSVSLVGNEATLRVGRRVVADVQTYNEDLKPANLLLGRKLLAVAEREQQVFTDDFERADQALDSTSAWLRADLEVGSLSIVSGKAVGSNIGNVYNQTLANNQWAQLNFGGVFASGTGKGAAILLRGTGGQSSFTGYAITLERDNTAAGDVLGIRRVLNATNYTTAFSQGALLASTRVAEFASSSPDTIIKAEIVGNTIYAYVNGILALITTDAGGPSSGFAGIWSNTATISTFSAGGLGPTKVTLNNANLIVSRTLSCDTATYTEDLKPANLVVGRKLVAKVYADEQLFSDDFTGTNGVLGAEYTQQGDVPLRRDGLGNANAVGAGRGLAWPNTVSFADSHYAEITIVTIETTSNNSGIGLRIQNSASPAVEYGYIFRTGNAGAAYTFAQYNASSTNVNIITTNIIPQVGDRLRAVVVGNNQYFYVNNQLIAVGSTTSWSGGVPAIYGNGTIWKSDNFVAGNYGGLHLHGTYTNTRATRVLVCAPASYTIAGQVTNLLAGRNLTSDTQNYTLSLKDATLTKTTTARTITAGTQSYSLGGGQANLIVSRKVTSDTRAYTFAPQPANLLVGRKLTSDTRTYTFAPQPANLKVTRTLSGTVQSYTLSLKDASLKAGKKLTSDVGSYTLSLKDAAIKVGRKVTADKQTYTFNGNNANLKASRTLLSTTQNYTLSLKDATLKSSRKLTSDTRTYTFAPQPANLLFGRKLTSDVRAYTLSLKDANLKVDRKLTNDKQTYTLTGIPVGLSKTGALPPLTATTSTFTLNGNPVNLRVTRRLISDARSYTFNGNPANLLYGRKVTADKQTYSLSLKDAIVKVGKRLVADKQTYTLSLKDAALSRSRKIIGDSYSYSLSLKDANVKIGRKLTGNVQTYTLSLKDAALKSGRKLTGDTRPYSLSLKDSNLLYGRKITGEQASYVFTYNGMLFARGGFVKVWTGSAWVQKPLKVWNGTAWVSKPLKIWTGSTWRTY